MFSYDTTGGCLYWCLKPGLQCQELILGLGQEHRDICVITKSQDKSWGILIFGTLSGISHRSVPDLSLNVDNSHISLC